VRASTAPEKPSFGVSPTWLAAWEFTRAIALRPHVQAMQRDAGGRLADGNRYSARVPTLPTPPSAPWYIHLAGNDRLFHLLAFDFDASRDLDDDVEAAIEQATTFTKYLTALGISHVLCQSSTRGRLHVWVGLSEGVSVDVTRRLADAARANFGTLDHGMLKNAASGGVRPPLSPHRYDGVYSRVLTGDINTLRPERRSTTHGDLIRLIEVLETAAPSIRPEDSRPSGLVDAGYTGTGELQAWGRAHFATIAGGANPSHTAYLCLLAAAQANWSLSDVAALVDTAPGLEHYRTRDTGQGHRQRRNPRDRQARLERQWARAQQHVSRWSALPPARPTTEAPRDLSELDTIVSRIQQLQHRLTVNPGRFSGAHGSPTHRSVLIGLAYLMLRAGKATVASSVRELGDLIGVDRTTTAAALRSLQREGFITRHRLHHGTNASEWTLTPAFSTAHQVELTHHKTNARPPAELFALRTALHAEFEEQIDTLRHDLYTRKGIGHLGGRLHALLNRTSRKTLRELSDSLGISEGHTASLLGRLKKHRLIVERGREWLRARKDGRNAAAKHLGIDGTLERRRQMHSNEQELWEWWQAECERLSPGAPKRARAVHVTQRELFEPDRPARARAFPKYPRGLDGRADHRMARHDIWAKAVKPGRVQFLYAA
jgi:DNA-binding MarR family transcriptional regulator